MCERALTLSEHSGSNFRCLSTSTSLMSPLSLSHSHTLAAVELSIHFSLFAGAATFRKAGYCVCVNTPMHPFNFAVGVFVCLLCSAGMIRQNGSDGEALLLDEHHFCCSRSSAILLGSVFSVGILSSGSLVLIWKRGGDGRGNSGRQLIRAANMDALPACDSINQVWNCTNTHTDRQRHSLMPTIDN